MNPTKLIEYSSLSRRNKRIILTGDCFSMKIDDKEREISLIIRLSKRNCTKLAESEFKVTSLASFKPDKIDGGIIECSVSMCKLNINIEEEK